MANANRPSGLSPVGYLNGAPWNGKLGLYFIPSTDANAYALGDPVVLAGSGSTSGQAASVVLATAGTGNSVLGPIVTAGATTEFGPYVDPTNLGTTVIPATKTVGYWVGVADDPNTLFEVQEDSVGNNLATTDLGNNFDLVSGTNNSYVSGWMLDSSTAATTNTLQLKLMYLARRTDNAIGQYAKWVVLINNHSYRAGTTGV